MNTPLSGNDDNSPSGPPLQWRSTNHKDRPWNLLVCGWEGRCLHTANSMLPVLGLVLHSICVLLWFTNQKRETFLQTTLFSRKFFCVIRRFFKMLFWLLFLGCYFWPARLLSIMLLLSLFLTRPLDQFFSLPRVFMVFMLLWGWCFCRWLLSDFVVVISLGRVIWG